MSISRGENFIRNLKAETINIKKMIENEKRNAIPNIYEKKPLPPAPK